MVVAEGVAGPCASPNVDCHAAISMVKTGGHWLSAGPERAGGRLTTTPFVRSGRARGGGWVGERARTRRRPAMTVCWSQREQRLPELPVDVERRSNGMCIDHIDPGGFFDFGCGFPRLAADGLAATIFVEQKRSGRWPAVGRRAGEIADLDGAHPISTVNDTSLAALRTATGGMDSRGRTPIEPARIFK